MLLIDLKVALYLELVRLVSYWRLLLGCVGLGFGDVLYGLGLVHQMRLGQFPWAGNVGRAVGLRLEEAFVIGDAQGSGVDAILREDLVDSLLELPLWEHVVFDPRIDYDCEELVGKSVEGTDPLR